MWNNFYDLLFFFQNEEVIQNGVYLSREEFAPRATKSYVKELTATEKGGKDDHA